MLTCKKASELLLEYVEATLSPQDTEAMGAHLRGCTPCQQFAESYRKTVRLCRDALVRQAPDGVGERLLAFLQRETGQGRQTR